MIGFDTNVFLRLIVKDDTAQTAQVLKAIERVETAGDTIFLSDMVLCELVWTMRKAYKTKPAEITSALREIAVNDTLRFESLDRLQTAINEFSRSRGDFADYLIKGKALAEGCETLLTFDKALQSKPGFSKP